MIFAAYLPAMLLLLVLQQLGVPAELAEAALLILVTGYWLWLHWFLAWRGLALSWTRAVILVGSVIVATALLCAVAQLLPPHVGMSLALK